MVGGASQVFRHNGYDVLLYAVDPNQNPEQWNLPAMAKRVDGILGSCSPVAEQQFRELDPLHSEVAPTRYAGCVRALAAAGLPTDLSRIEA